MMEHIVIADEQRCGVFARRVNWLIGRVRDGETLHIDSSYSFDRAMDIAREYDQQWCDGTWEGPYDGSE